MNSISLINIVFLHYSFKTNCSNAKKRKILLLFNYYYSRDDFIVARVSKVPCWIKIWITPFLMINKNNVYVIFILIVLLFFHDDPGCYIYPPERLNPCYCRLEIWRKFSRSTETQPILVIRKSNYYKITLASAVISQKVKKLGTRKRRAKYSLDWA